MVIIKIMGGLGNQMFQYATARRLSYTLKVPLKIDLTWFENNQKPDTARHYELQLFNINQSVASVGEIALLKSNRSKHSVDWIKKYFIRPNKSHSISWVKERHFQFDRDILTLSDNVYLDGYWQSEKYFREIRQLLLEEFTLGNDIVAANKPLAESIVTNNSISLHVRRGDFISNPVTNNYHGICSLDYYYKAIEAVTKQLDAPHFFIFSDDVPWVKNNFKLNYPSTIIKPSGSYNPHEDLYLMTLCKHHIIANSSFSWWGAWLSDNNAKMVIAPKKWFNNSNLNTSDLLPTSWITI